MRAELQKNADRFTGFADVYDEARPSMPQYPLQVLQRYLGRRPTMVVDLGCGTGLSTAVWVGRCDTVVGVDPSADMLAVASSRQLPGATFVRAFAHQTGLPDGCADVAVCSQSFHWMEPKSTLREVGRILQPGGVFATVDCDWPPVADWRAEKAFLDLYQQVQRLETELPEVRESFVRYRKEQHLEHLRQSGLFRYCRELLFANTEPCSADRLVRLLLSQGSVQAVLKQAPDRIEGELAALRANLRDLYGDAQFPVDFCYRMRVGVR